MKQKEYEDSLRPASQDDSFDEETFVANQKLAALGRLASLVMHELANQMTVISGYVELALADQDTDKLNERLNKVVASIAQSREISENWLNFSRKDPADFSMVSLNDLVEQVTGILEVSQRGVQIEKRLDVDLPDVMGNLGALQGTVMNLCLNAVDAMNKCGELTLVTEVVDLDSMPEGTCLVLKTGKYVSLQVSDTGCGMDADTCCQVFEPFFTTKEKGAGTGLGLYLVSRTMRQLGGEAKIESELGVGTTITLYFPLQQ